MFNEIPLSHASVGGTGGCTNAAEEHRALMPGRLDGWRSLVMQDFVQTPPGGCLQVAQPEILFGLDVSIEAAS